MKKRKNIKIIRIILAIIIAIISSIVFNYFRIKTIDNKKIENNKAQEQKGVQFSPEKIVLDDQVKAEALNIINIDLENNADLSLSKNKENDKRIISTLETVYWDKNVLMSDLKKGTLGERSLRIKQEYNDDILTDNLNIVESENKFNLENNIVLVRVKVFKEEVWNQFDTESGRRSVSGGYDTYDFKIFKQNGKFYILDKVRLPNYPGITDFSEYYQL